MKLTLIFVIIIGIVAQSGLGKSMTLYDSDSLEGFVSDEPSGSPTDDMKNFSVSTLLEIDTPFNSSFPQTLPSVIMKISSTFKPEIEIKLVNKSVDITSDMISSSVPVYNDIPEIVYIHQSLINFQNILIAIVIIVVVFVLIYLIYKIITRNNRKYLLQKELYPDSYTPIYKKTTSSKY